VQFEPSLYSCGVGVTFDLLERAANLREFSWPECERLLMARFGVLGLARHSRTAAAKLVKCGAVGDKFLHSVQPGWNRRLLASPPIGLPPEVQNQEILQAECRFSTGPGLELTDEQ
jgi:hypothetical protein